MDIHCDRPNLCHSLEETSAKSRLNIKYYGINYKLKLLWAFQLVRMTESIEFTFDLPVYPERVYRAWLDEGEHSRFSGAPARINPVQGGMFSLLGGVISGELRILSPVGRIVQSWSNRDLDPSSQGVVELLLSPTCTGCELQLIHRGISDGKSREVLNWWESVYFRPLKQYFDAWVGEYTADMGDG
jgi:activator of HSP90 ATPase